MRVPSIDIYHRIRNPSMDEKVELQYRLRWLSQGSISKVPQSMVDASLELYPIPYSMLKLLCLSEPKKKAGRLGSYAKPEKRNLLSIFELRGYDRLLIRLFLKKYSWLISWVVRLLSTWVVYFIFRPGKPMTLQVRFSFNIDIPMTMDQLRSTPEEEDCPRSPGMEEKQDFGRSRSRKGRKAKVQTIPEENNPRFRVPTHSWYPLENY